jgi:hypothetical protein
MRGWMPIISKANTPERLAAAYGRLSAALDGFNRLRVLPLDLEAARHFGRASKLVTNCTRPASTSRMHSLEGPRRQEGLEQNVAVKDGARPRCVHGSSRCWRDRRSARTSAKARSAMLSISSRLMPALSVASWIGASSSDRLGRLVAYNIASCTNVPKSLPTSAARCRSRASSSGARSIVSVIAMPLIAVSHRTIRV